MCARKKRKKAAAPRKQGMGWLAGLFALLLLGSGAVLIYLQQNPGYPANNSAKKANQLVKAYPGFIKEVNNNYIIWKDGTKMQYTDSHRIKLPKQLLEHPSPTDQFTWPYTMSDTVTEIPKNHDPGRIRHLPLFEKMYGQTEQEVRKKLVPVAWLPNTTKDTLLFNRENGAAAALQKVVEELDRLPHLLPYLKKPGGTFVWRPISGTARSSAHSFGIAIDINVDSSHYWQWDCSCTNEEQTLTYHNRIPMAVVRIFEKHKFIWGGRWYHYDTMHFEYRPEFFE